MAKVKEKKTTKPRNDFETRVDKAIDNLSTELNFTYAYEPEKYVVKVDVTYNPDWTIYKNGKKLVIEGKGYFRDEDRKKVLAFSEQYGSEVFYHIVFERDNPIYKGSKFKYSDWCNKHGISYSVKSLPKELFECLEQ